MSKDSILDHMREEGLRMTPQRVHIVELLFELSHPTAERIYSMMTGKFPFVSQATVYNTLRKLKELGVVRELANGDKSSHFEVSEAEHWHFNCKVCGGIYDLEPSETEALMAAGTRNGAFEVDRYQVEFYGVCETCRE
ncbi:Fur family transcriptional regulator [Cohnella sp. GCM10027633]|uniref:Fur family transcriptional regulator n=1 Tax=unclassified Cohnella TaxID=2636738 RepID=UPI003636F0A6